MNGALGELYRRALDIDGTAGDAQDIPHPYIEITGITGYPGCVVCGLAESYRQHHKPGIPTAAEVTGRVNETLDRIEALRGTLEAGHR